MLVHLFHIQPSSLSIVVILLILCIHLNIQNNIFVQSTHQYETIHSEEASWEFEGDTNGWGNSTTEELHTELYVRGGELRGRIRGPYPHFDSPTFIVNANNLPDNASMHNLQCDLQCLLYIQSF